MLIFGGAIENNENSFVTTNDTYLLTVDTLLWTKLESTLTRPRHCSLPARRPLHRANRH